MVSTLGAGFELALPLHTATCTSMARLRDNGHASSSTVEQYWDAVADRFAHGLWRIVLEPCKQLESKCGSFFISSLSFCPLRAFCLLVTLLTAFIINHLQLS
jgi:hypothetical protein